jgi:hypothetical protein
MRNMRCDGALAPECEDFLVILFPPRTRTAFGLYVCSEHFGSKSRAINDHRGEARGSARASD